MRKIFCRFTYSLSVRNRANLLVLTIIMNVEHSDVRTQGVYSLFLKRLLRDHRQQHPPSSDSLLYIFGNITEDYDKETEYPTFLGMREQQAIFSSPAKYGLARDEGRGLR